MEIKKDFNIGQIVTSDNHDNKRIIDSIHCRILCKEAYAGWKNQFELHYNSIDWVSEKETSIATWSSPVINPILVSPVEEVPPMITKYEMGDIVYPISSVYRDGKVTYKCWSYNKLRITTIDINISKDGVEIGYKEGNNGCGTVHPEDDLFPTEEACIAAAEERTIAWAKQDALRQNEDHEPVTDYFVD